MEKNGEIVKKEEPPPPPIKIKESSALRLNNNLFKSLVGLPSALATISPSPETIHWIDFSFNNIETIDDV